MDWESFCYGVFGVMFLLLILLSFGLVHVGNTDIVSGNAVGDFGDMPEKCRVPAGQDVESWKEHLSHHSETQECLKYFE